MRVRVVVGVRHRVLLLLLVVQRCARLAVARHGRVSGVPGRASRRKGRIGQLVLHREAVVRAVEGQLRLLLVVVQRRVQLLVVGEVERHPRGWREGGRDERRVCYPASG